MDRVESSVPPDNRSWMVLLTACETWGYLPEELGQSQELCSWKPYEIQWGQVHRDGLSLVLNMGWGLNKLRNAEQKDLGELANEKLYMAQWCVLAAWKNNCILGWVKSSMSRMFREMILPLLWSSETPPGIVHPDLVLPAQEEHGPIQVHPEVDREDDQRAGTPLLWRQAERVAQTEEEKTTETFKQHSSI